MTNPTTPGIAELLDNVIFAAEERKRTYGVGTPAQMREAERDLVNERADFLSYFADLERDAERYRWLLNQAWFQCEACFRFSFEDNGTQKDWEEKCRSAIDAAIAQRGGKS